MIHSQLTTHHLSQYLKEVTYPSSCPWLALLLFVMSEGERVREGWYTVFSLLREREREREFFKFTSWFMSLSLWTYKRFSFIGKGESVSHLSFLFSFFIFIWKVRFVFIRVGPSLFLDFSQIFNRSEFLFCFLYTSFLFLNFCFVTPWRGSDCFYD